MVSVKWEPLSFTESELTLQLYFARPFDISAFEDPNTIELIFLDGSLFVRMRDGMALPDNYQADS